MHQNLDHHFGILMMTFMVLSTAPPTLYVVCVYIGDLSADDEAHEVVDSGVVPAEGSTEPRKRKPDSSDPPKKRMAIFLRATYIHLLNI